MDVVAVTLNPAIDITAWIPELNPGSLNRVQNFTESPGGKGINVAAALASFGHRVAVTGFLGDQNAAIFTRLFEAKKIEDQMLRLLGATRLCIKICDGTQTTELNFPGLNVSSDECQNLLTALERIPAPWVALSGSLPPGVPHDYYVTLIQNLRRSGRKVLLDTSGPALAQALAEKPEIIKPNLHELEALVGKTCQSPELIVEAARPLLSKGMIVVSMGSKGACFITAEKALHAQGPTLPPLSTVGAGDAMVAGILSATLQQLPLPELACRAVAFSLAALSGGGFFSLERVQQLASQVTLLDLEKP